MMEQDPKGLPNMEKYHEEAYCYSRVGHADCRTDVRSVRKCCAHVPCELLVRQQWLLMMVAGTGSEPHEAANRFCALDLQIGFDEAASRIHAVRRRQWTGPWASRRVVRLRAFRSHYIALFSKRQQQKKISAQSTIS